MQNESCHIFQLRHICCYELKAAQWKPKTGTCSTYRAPLTCKVREALLLLQRLLQAQVFEVTTWLLQFLSLCANCFLCADLLGRH